MLRRTPHVLAAALLAAGTAVPAHASAPRCESVRVPGAARQTTACLADLTTRGTSGTKYTDVADWTGLAAKNTRNPGRVKGVQIDGYFPDGSRNNTLHGWNHDAQFVIRLPRRWNGKLVVTGAPGTRRQYALDFAISDQVLAQGYAFASTDKGNNGVNFYTDGRRPGDAVDEWNRRVTQLTRAARKVVRAHYGRAPRRTYMTGVSNGGYLTRWQLENHPELYDGGVDWEGALYAENGRNPFDSLPTAVAFVQGKASHDDMIKAGFAPGSEPLWPYHALAYWGGTQKTYRAEFDPAYDRACPGAKLTGSLAEMAAPCASDAAYDWDARPASVRESMRRASLTGNIRRPMLTLHGTLDSLLVPADSDAYAAMVEKRGRGKLHRYYRIEGGNHVDGLYDTYPWLVRPILPCYRSAFAALTAWVEHGTPPPSSRLVHRPPSGDLVNGCTL